MSDGWQNHALHRLVHSIHLPIKKDHLKKMKMPNKPDDDEVNEILKMVSPCPSLPPSLPPFLTPLFPSHLPAYVYLHRHSFLSDLSPLAPLPGNDASHSASVPQFQLKVTHSPHWHTKGAPLLAVSTSVENRRAAGLMPNDKNDLKDWGLG